MTNIGDRQPGARSKSARLWPFQQKESEEPPLPDGFDPRFYLDRYADVAAAGIDPLFHYVNYGKVEGRSPNAEVEASKLAVYDVVASNFDRTYYLRHYPDVAAAGIDPVQHYLVAGASEGRNPTPDFATSYYVKRYPDVRESELNPFYHYLTIGLPQGRGGSFFSQGEPAFEAMCEIIGIPSAVAASELSARRRDLRSRLADGQLGEMVRRAGELEPLIHQSWLGAIDPRLPPFHSEFVTGQVVGMHRLQTLANHRRAKAVLAISSCTVGGVQRTAGHLACALSEIYAPDEVVVVATDKSAMQCRHWFPPECRVLDFTAETEAANSRDRQRLLIEFIRSLRPSAVFNMNSRLLWDALAPYGNALSRSSALFAFLFCNDIDANGFPVGYPIRNFYRYYDILTGVVTDSRFLADDLSTRFQLPPSHKITVLNTSVDPNQPAVPTATVGVGRPQVFWAGRFVRQKRVDIVAAIAARLSGSPLILSIAAFQICSAYAVLNS